MFVCFCLQSAKTAGYFHRSIAASFINLGVFLVLSMPIEWFLHYFSYHFILFVLCTIAAFVCIGVCGMCWWCGGFGVELRTKCD